MVRYPDAVQHGLPLGGSPQVRDEWIDPLGLMDDGGGFVGRFL